MPPRPDPDDLLRKVQEAEARQHRGRLKVYFGAAPGVGKTFAMLLEARALVEAGRDLVVGVLETHGRHDTEALAEGFEVLPRKDLPYMGRMLPEFDLEAALARRPEVILVDELAHANAMGSRHAKRWQDVLDLLDAGIEVHTTLNVQHLESLKDAVAQITGVVVRETVPDTLVEQADEVELVDLPPDELLERLREGKVYVPEQARHAQTHFFRKGNLLALRELALRHTAENVYTQMRRYRETEGIHRTWATGDRLLVCIGPGPLAERLIRATRRLSATSGAPWVALHVESPKRWKFSEEERASIERNLRYAEKLGGETAVIEGGPRIHEDILAFAQSRHITRIVVGKPSGHRWLDLLLGSPLDDLLRHSGDIDIYAITGEASRAPEPARFRPRLTSPLRNYLLSVLVVGLATGASALAFPRTMLADIVMLYLLGILVVATRFGRGPSLLASLLSVAAFDFIFIPPYFTFAVADFRHLGTFSVMLAVGVVTGNLTERIRAQARLAREREARTQALFQLGQDLARSPASAELAAAALAHLNRTFRCRALILQPDGTGRLLPPRQAPFWSDQEQGVAQWAFDHARPAGLGTSTLPGARATHLPLQGAEGTLGVLCLVPEGRPAWEEANPRQLLDAFAIQIGLALERALLGERSAEDRQRAEAERLRNALLSSVSHDLRTPLGVITGAVSAALETPDLPEATRRDLLASAQEEAQRLHRLVSNLLDITRLESGALDLHREWMPVEEVVGAALTRREFASQAHRMQAHLPATLPLVALDPVLMEQVLVNLLDNALKYSPPDQPVEVKAWVAGSSLVLAVVDQGPGLAPGEEVRIFDKLARGEAARSRPGAGLGLAICKGIVTAHGGQIQAANRPAGGTQVLVSLPLGTPPALPVEAP